VFPFENRQLQKIYLVGPSSFFLRRGARFCAKFGSCWIRVLTARLCASSFQYGRERIRAIPYCPETRVLCGNSVRAHNESLRSWTDKVEGITGHEGQYFVTGIVQDLRVLRRNHLGRIHEIAV
jgi:hypothetical protein